MSFSAFQLSPLVAALWLPGLDSLAWTAPFSAAFALASALARGYVIQPDIRGRPEDCGVAYDARVAVAVGVICACVLAVVGLSGVLSDADTLIVLALATPFLVLVEMERAAAAAMRSRRISTTLLSILAGLMVATCSSGGWIAGSPTAISIVWVCCYGLLAADAMRARSFSLELGVRRTADGGRKWLALSNVSGQVAAQAPLLAISAVGAADAVSLLQGARLVFRPIAIIAGALPVHLLPRLTEAPTSVSRLARHAAPIIGGSAALALAALPGALVMRGSSDSLRSLSVDILLLGALVTILSVTEATLGVWRVASHDERFLAGIRLAAGFVGTATIAQFADGATNTEVMLLMLGLPVAVISAALLWRGNQ